MQLNNFIDRCFLLTLGLLLAIPKLSAQTIVTDYLVSWSSIAAGNASKEKVLGKLVFDVNSDRIISMNLYPASKTYLIGDRSHKKLRFLGPNNLTYLLVGFSYFQDDENGQVIYHDCLTGTESTIALGGVFGQTKFPKTMTGPIFNAQGGTDSANRLRQGAQTLKLNMKQTQYFNAKNASLEEVVSELEQGFKNSGYSSPAD